MTAAGSLSGVGIVAARELRTRLRHRGFVLTTAVTGLLLAVFLVLHDPLLVQLGRTTVGVAGQANAVSEPLVASAERVDHELRIIRYPAAEQAHADLVDGDLDALVTGSVAKLRVFVASGLDPRLEAWLTGISRQEVLDAKLIEAGLDPDTVHNGLDAIEVTVRTLDGTGPEPGRRTTIALVTMLALLLALASHSSAVARAVVDEKANRVIEILLTGVRPGQLLLGKVAGIGAAGLAQLAVLGLAALAVLTATGVLTHGTGVAAVGWGLLCFALGFALYAPVFAAAAALRTNRADLRPALAPPLLALGAAATAAAVVVAAPDSPMASALSLFPPFTPIVIPVRLIMGPIGFAETIVALVVSVAASAVIGRLAERVHGAALVHTGHRVGLRDAVRG